MECLLKIESCKMCIDQLIEQLDSSADLQVDRPAGREDQLSSGLHLTFVSAAFTILTAYPISRPSLLAIVKLHLQSFEAFYHLLYT